MNWHFAPTRLDAFLGVAKAATLAIALCVTTTSRADESTPAAPLAEEAAKAQARAWFDKGLSAYEKRRYKDAIDAFLEAERLYPNPVLSFNAARAYDELGDVAGALRFYRSYLRRSPGAPDLAEVAKRVGELENALRDKGVQQVTILSKPEGATVAVDGRPVGVTPWTGEIFPGTHQLKLTHEGYEQNGSEFVLLAHRATDVQRELAALPETHDDPVPFVPAPARPRAAPTKLPLPQALEPEKHGVQPTTLVVLGFGAASLTGAGVFEILRGSSEDAARAEPTQLGRQEKIDQAESRNTAARILAGVGAAATVAGGVLLYLDLSAGSKSQTTVGALGARCGPAGCGLTFRGRFQ